jgi:hypothetical protein
MKINLGKLHSPASVFSDLLFACREIKFSYLFLVIRFMGREEWEPIIRSTPLFRYCGRIHVSGTQMGVFMSKSW